MSAMPKTVPHLYAVCREEDTRIEFAEDAAKLIELFVGRSSGCWRSLSSPSPSRTRLYSSDRTDGSEACGQLANAGKSRKTKRHRGRGSNRAPAVAVNAARFNRRSLGGRQMELNLSAFYSARPHGRPLVTAIASRSNRP
jgi:hypothetical protein